jgi:limonene-1,2-epoxide hydrolase
VRFAPILLAAALLAGCGSHTASPTDVVRAWSAALDRNDNEGAARLFDDGSTIVQNGELTLATHADAVRWNAELPCGGTIVAIEKRGGNDVLAVFRLRERPGHRCDAPGTKAAALFRVRDGKIELWHQTDVPPPSGGDTSGLTV